MIQSSGGFLASSVRDPELKDLLMREDRIAQDSEGLVPQNDPNWLRLPLERRDKAVDRLEVLLAYEQEESGLLSAAEAAAKRLNITTRQFYGILKAWRARRSVWSLVPYSGRTTAKVPKLDPEVAAQLTAAIETAALSGTLRSPHAIVGHVLENWPQDLPSPSHPTVRAHVDRQIRSGVLGERPLRLNDSGDPQEEIETASAFGEVLVLDHTAPDIFLDGEVRRRPVLTLAIDLYARVPIGFAIGEDKPNAGLVLEALRDAELRSARRANDGRIKPRLVLATTTAPEWRDLAKSISEAGITAAIRWAPRLHAGGPTSRLIGSELAGIPVRARKVHAIKRAPTDFDRKRHPLLTLDQAQIVIGDAVDRLLDERLPGMTVSAVETGLFADG